MLTILNTKIFSSTSAESPQSKNVQQLHTVTQRSDGSTGPQLKFSLADVLSYFHLVL
jgi:hypothetical protein